MTGVDWTRAMSTADLEIMYTHSTDAQTCREILAELGRRDDIAAARRERIAAAMAVNSAPSW